ncbi:MAG: hypothetical protein ACC742_07360, partial [Thermoanaerobaculales bacterium]
MVRVGYRVLRFEAAAALERRLISATVVGFPMLRAASGLSEESRAISRLMSFVARDPTSRKTRSISSPGLATLGDLVASGPVMTTPIWSPSEGITRSPGLAKRVRWG